IGDGRSHADLAVARETLELVEAVDRDDVRRSRPSEVDLDHEVGAAGQKCRLADAGKVIQYRVDAPGDLDAHPRIITSVLSGRSLALAHFGRRGSGRSQRPRATTR